MICPPPKFFRNPSIPHRLSGVGSRGSGPGAPGAPGSRVEFFPEKNPPAQLALGQVVFTKTYCPPGVAERITYESVIDVTLLAL